MIDLILRQKEAILMIRCRACLIALHIIRFITFCQELSHKSMLAQEQRVW